MANGVIVPSKIDTGWKVINENLFYRRINSIVYVSITGVATTSSWAQVGTLPSDCLPSKFMYQCVYASGANTANVFINSTGQVQYLGYGGINALVSFPIG